MLKLFLCCLGCLVAIWAGNGHKPRGEACHEPSAQNCDQLGTLIYEDLGCEPVYSRRNECPVRYNCNFEPVNGTCLFRNNYINVYNVIPDNLLKGSCQTQCFCLENGRFACPIIECIEYFVNPEPGCYWALDLNNSACCSDGQNCPSDNRTFGECTVYGQTYREGERFNSQESCSRCVCPANFDGKLRPPACQRLSCATQTKFDEQFLQKCAPLYDILSNASSILCCPTDWICEQNQTIVTLSKVHVHGKRSDFTCQFGDKTIELGDGFVEDDGPFTTTCECRISPLLTCKRLLKNV